MTSPWQLIEGGGEYPVEEGSQQGNRCFDQLARLIRDAERILVFTGAGISTPISAANKEPVSQEEFVTSLEARRAYWCSKREVWDQLRSIRPNAVHWAIVELERRRKLEMVVTQNVDGLHLWAGTSPSRVVELNGTHAELRCQSCGLRTDPAPHYALFQRDLNPPTCSCGGYLRHATGGLSSSVLSNELSRAGSAAAGADLVIAVGSTLDIYPAAALPLLAAQKGTPYVVINDGPTGHDTHPLVTIRLDGDVKRIFPRAVAVACRRPTRNPLV